MPHFTSVICIVKELTRLCIQGRAATIHVSPPPPTHPQMNPGIVWLFLFSGKNVSTTNRTQVANQGLAVGQHCGALTSLPERCCSTVNTRTTNKTQPPATLLHCRTPINRKQKTCCQAEGNMAVDSLLLLL